MEVTLAVCQASIVCLHLQTLHSRSLLLPSACRNGGGPSSGPGFPWKAAAGGSSRPSQGPSLVCWPLDLPWVPGNLEHHKETGFARDGCRRQRVISKWLAGGKRGPHSLVSHPITCFKAAQVTFISLAPQPCFKPQRVEVGEMHNHRKPSSSEL